MKTPSVGIVKKQCKMFPYDVAGVYFPISTLLKPHAAKSTSPPASNGQCGSVGGGKYGANLFDGAGTAGRPGNAGMFGSGGIGGANGLARVFGMSGADPTMFTEHSHANLFSASMKNWHFDGGLLVRAFSRVVQLSCVRGPDRCADETAAVPSASARPRSDASVPQTSATTNMVSQFILRSALAPTYSL